MKLKAVIFDLDHTLFDRHGTLREVAKQFRYAFRVKEGVTDEDDIDNIDILARTGRDEFVNNGSNEDWLALCDFCKSAVLAPSSAAQPAAGTPAAPARR